MMELVFRFILSLFLTCWLFAPGSLLVSADKTPSKCITEGVLSPDSGSSFKTPEHNQLYLFTREKTQGDTSCGNFRFQFLTLLNTRIVPRDFHFCKNIRLTFYLIDKKAPVPLFIQGHALLC